MAPQCQLQLCPYPLPSSLESSLHRVGFHTPQQRRPPAENYVSSITSLRSRRMRCPPFVGSCRNFIEVQCLSRGERPFQMLKISWKLTQGEVTAGPENVRSLAYLSTASKGYSGAEGREVTPTMACCLLRKLAALSGRLNCDVAQPMHRCPV